MRQPITIIMGKFYPPTMAHVRIVKKAVITHWLPVCVVIIKPKQEDRIPFEMTKEIFSESLDIAQVNVMFMEQKNGFIEALREMNFEPKFLYCGSDRKVTYTSQINRYKDRLNLDITLKEIPRRTRCISATRVRNALKENDIKEFKRCMHRSQWKKFDELKRVMG